MIDGTWQSSKTRFQGEKFLGTKHRMIWLRKIPVVDICVVIVAVVLLAILVRGKSNSLDHKPNLRFQTEPASIDDCIADAISGGFETVLYPGLAASTSQFGEVNNGTCRRFPMLIKSPELSITADFHT